MTTPKRLADPNATPGGQCSICNILPFFCSSRSDTLISGQISIRRSGSMKILPGSIGNIRGFTTLGKYVGIKAGRLDFAVIFSDRPCSAAAVYTKNRVKGAPLYVTMEHLKGGRAQAIVVNSGIANVCTGQRGIRDAKATASLAAAELGISPKDVLVASTGLIGAYLPMGKIRRGIRGMKKSLSKMGRAADAILTTDTVRKEICVKEGNFTVAGIAKGSGMISPNMATMLAFICTDAKIAPPRLSAMLREAVASSFNMMTIDMDTSTSDMCIALANGSAGSVDESEFRSALSYVCAELAKKIAADGEGASKLMEVRVRNAASLKSARLLAKSVVSSNLVKCALYGSDPNWGRLLCAMGNSGAAFDERKVDVWFGSKRIVRRGVAAKADAGQIRRLMDGKELLITIDMNAGHAQAVAYGCDMTEDYVRINAHYHT